jgi:D-sedoheptulose 7-phosphate isomerase
MKKLFSVSNYFNEHLQKLAQLDAGSFQSGIDMIKLAFDSNKKIITCGNGGSAFTASHYITDWNKMINLSTGKKFRGISLCDNIGLITAYGNDINFKDVFSGQIDAIMDEGDLLVAVSGSGNSPNILNAIKAARRNNGKVLGIVGYDGGEMIKICDHNVWINSFDMQICEDVHLMFGHMVMKSLCGYEIIC